MLKNLKKNNSGFTIIEVLIVLAIAGLIMLVVFLAVPALQRNQRNSGYRSEANRVLAAAQEISANNGGSVLTASASGTANSDAAKILTSSNAKNVTLVTVEAKGATNTAPSLTSAVLVTGAKCPSALVTITAPGAGGAGTGTVALTTGTTRQTVLVYAVEDSAGAVVGQCQES
ncbi:MAG: type II secretion system protein [Patescibacteria group bacterium]|nr:type II secretion system protein [Patescibacteria group bacterium]